MKSDFHFLQEAVEADVKLYSVFERITLGNAQLNRNDQHKARVLTIESIVRTADNLTDEQLKNELNSALENDVKQFKKLREPAQPETLPHLIQKYGWRIGNPETSKSDIPFADRWRIQKALNQPSADGEYLLFKGDLTGIQEYIYHNIEQKRVGGLRKLAQRLRGRSTMVALLSDFLANAYLRELGLSPFHLLFCGGGHFNLLIPADREKELDVLTRQFNTIMRDIFDDKLELLTAQVTCNESIREHAGIYFQQLLEQLESQKYKARAGWLSEVFSSKKKMEGLDNVSDGEMLGKRFPKMQLIIETTSSEKIEDSIGSFRVLWFPTQGNKQIHSLFIAVGFEAANLLLLKNKETINSASIFKVNDTDIFPDDTEWSEDFDFPVSFGFRFFGKNTPLNPESDEILDFEELARPDVRNESERERNGKLAAMRLDVDDLGCVFSKGLKSDDSLERLATLSRELGYFFTAHFDQLAIKHNIYVIYSGGDDAFVVGRWDKLLHFACELHNDFREFASKNEDMHFSAGVYMGNPHFPVGRFYGEAEYWQNEAKSTKEKNRIAVFSHPLGWKSFGEMLLHGADLLKIMGDQKHGDNPKFSSGLAYRLLRIVKTSFYEKTDARNGEKRGQMNPEKFAENISRLRYFFAKQGFSKDKVKELQEGITRNLINTFLKAFDFNNEKSKFARDYLIALNYALFQKKYNGNNNE